MRTLVWFRGKDLRLADNAPLTDAIAGGEVVCVFLFDPFFLSPERDTFPAHRVQFLFDSVEALHKNIAHKGSTLLTVAGQALEVIPTLCQQFRITQVSTVRWVEPFMRERDVALAKALSVPFKLYEGETLAPPDSVRTQSGGVFNVFTPFARAFEKSVVVGKPIPAPARIPPLPADVASFQSSPMPTFESLRFSRNEAIQKGGEHAAIERMKNFLHRAGADYDQNRNRMDLDGTSRLSADLKFGTLSVRSVWAHASATLEGDARHSFLNELLWRDFAHQLLFRRPELLNVPFRADFLQFPYIDDVKGWRAWVDGTTGYPVVDASARQLLASGFVHNRARMISASFLTKHLLIDFRRGEAHYLKWLTDGDWAQNDAGWQWSAGCGCDAQPYFRVFNPVSQGEKFDPNGDYVRRWVPELAKLPTKYIHAPWEASPLELKGAGVTLGQTYPHPVVDHAKARARFLALAKAHLAQQSAKRA
jgi:deoxyribodipyrimidine photo-lyase